MKKPSATDRKVRSMIIRLISESWSFQCFSRQPETCRRERGYASAVSPSSAAFTGRKAAEKNYENSKKLFCDIFAFEVPSA